MVMRSRVVESVVETRLPRGTDDCRLRSRSRSSGNVLLDAVYEHQVAVLVEPADITGVQSAPAQCPRRLLRPAQVATHHVRSAYDDLTGLPGRQATARAVQWRYLAMATATRVLGSEAQPPAEAEVAAET